MVLNPVCPRYRTSEESTLHSLRDCPQVKVVWLKNPLNFFVSNFSSDSFEAWMDFLANQLKGEELNFAFILVWMIWKDKNFLVF